MLHLNQCTFNKTSTDFALQHWRHCFDCFKSSEEGICLMCVQLCHEDHKLGPLKYSRFFCDCGSTCKIRSKENDTLELEMAKDFSMDKNLCRKDLNST